jgi:primary-amine oxidase
MTDTAIRSAEVPGALPAHPLDPASAQEYLAGRRILAAAGLVAEPTRFAYYGLEEPAKDEVLARPAGQPPDRRLRAFLIDVRTGESADVVVSLSQERVISHRTLDPRADGRLPILDQDFAIAQEVVRADPGWRAAMA